MTAQRKEKRKICVFIGSRANYGSIKSALLAFKQHPKLQLQIVVGSSALLDKYGEVVDIIEKEGFKVDDKIYSIVEGENPITMTKSAGSTLTELATSFSNLAPDMVLVVGDRFEVLSAAIAASYMNIPLVHTMGGEVSGSIDESIRHAITKLAHIHFPASTDARKRILKMGEHSKHVFHVGCPRMDEVKRILGDEHQTRMRFEGVGEKVDINQPFLFVSQHPITTEYGEGEAQITATLEALRELSMPTIMLWPNADAGSEDVARGIRKFREQNRKEDLNMFFFKNLPMDRYFTLMKKAACMIGNSSSLVREGSFIGTPGVLVGSRQHNRERGKNVIQVPHDSKAIVRAVKKQIDHGPYTPTKIYGDGTAGKQIARVLAGIDVDIQKQIAY